MSGQIIDGAFGGAQSQTVAAIRKSGRGAILVCQTDMDGAAEIYLVGIFIRINQRGQSVVPTTFLAERGGDGCGGLGDETLVHRFSLKPHCLAHPRQIVRDHTTRERVFGAFLTSASRPVDVVNARCGLNVQFSSIKA
jgi:hypothetical protein